MTNIDHEDTCTNHCALGVDRGSATNVLQMVDMKTGDILAQAGEPNGQRTNGEKDRLFGQ